MLMFYVYINILVQWDKNSVLWFWNIFLNFFVKNYINKIPISVCFVRVIDLSYFLDILEIVSK